MGHSTTTEPYRWAEVLTLRLREPCTGTVHAGGRNLKAMFPASRASLSSQVVEHWGGVSQQILRPGNGSDPRLKDNPGRSTSFRSRERLVRQDLNRLPPIEIRDCGSPEEGGPWFHRGEEPAAGS